MHRLPDVIHLEIFRHGETGWMIAISHDIPGLHVRGRSEKEIGKHVFDLLRTRLNDLIARRFSDFVAPAGYESYGEYSFDVKTGTAVKIPAEGIA